MAFESRDGRGTVRLFSRLWVGQQLALQLSLSALPLAYFLYQGPAGAAGVAYAVATLVAAGLPRRRSRRVAALNQRVLVRARRSRAATFPPPRPTTTSRPIVRSPNSAPLSGPASRQSMPAVLRRSACTAPSTSSGNVMVADADDTIVYMNKAVIEMFRCAAADLHAAAEFRRQRCSARASTVPQESPAHQRACSAGMRDTHSADVGSVSVTLRVSATRCRWQRHSGLAPSSCGSTAREARRGGITRIVAAANDGDLTSASRRPAKRATRRARRRDERAARPT